MANLLDQASIVLTPTAYDNGKVLCAKPIDGSGDFDFSRNSAATRVNSQGLVEDVQILSSNLVQNGSFSEQGAEEVSNGSFSQQGSELVTGGDFSNPSDWNKVNSTISGGKGNLDSLGGASLLFQSALVVGKNYKATLDVSNYNGLGTCALINSNGSVQFEITSNGNKEFYFTHGGTSTNLIFRAISGGAFSIDNCSVVEVGQNWTLGTGWSIGEDKAVATSATSSIFQAGLIVGVSYIMTVEVSNYTSGTLFPRLGYANEGEGFTSNGNFEFIGLCLGNGSVELRALGFNGSVTNISVKEVGQNWTLGTGWSIGDNKLVREIAVSGSYAQTSYDLGIIGNNYQISIDVAEVTSGILYVYGGLGGTPAISITSAGVYKINHIWASDQPLGIFCNNSFVGKVNSISVIEITDDTNLPRINYEGFSYQDALGSEEIVNGDFENGSANWNFANTGGSKGWRIANNKAICDTIGVANGRNLNSTTSLVNGKSYKVTLDIIQSEDEIGILVGSTLIDNAFPIGTNLGASYIINSSQHSGGIFALYGGSSDLQEIDNVSVKEYLGQEVVPDSGCGSWLWEPQSTNLITQSELFSDSYWTKSGASVVSGFISPDGTSNAFKLVSGSGGGNIIARPSLVSNTANTNSIYLKRVSGNGNVSLFNTAGNELVVTLTTEWKRFSVANSTNPSNGYAGVRLYGSGDEVLLFGAQTEQQSYSTSYIPTDGTQKTRNKDVCNNGGSVSTINSTEGVLYAEIAALANDGTYRLISLNDQTTNNLVYIGYDATANRITFSVRVATAYVFLNHYDISNATDVIKVALKYKENDFALWYNGTEVYTDSSGVTFPTNTLTKLNFDRLTLPFYGKTKALAVWKEALSDEELTLLTAPAPVAPTFTLDFDEITNQFTFSRASFGTIVNKQGLIETVSNIGPEEIVNGDFATDSDWSKGSGWSIANGTATHTGGASYLSQSILEPNKQYKVKIKVIQASGANFVQIYMGNSPASVLIQNVGEYEYIFTSQSLQTLGFALRGVGDIEIDNVSVKEYTEDDIPRIDYSTGTEAFLLEPQSTNLITQSELFSDSSWIKSNVSITSNDIISPDGNVNAAKLIASNNTAEHQIKTPISLSTNQNISLFAKKAGYNFLIFRQSTSDYGYKNVCFDLLNGQLGTIQDGYSNVKIDDYGNDWYRCSFTITNRNATNIQILVAEQDNVQSFLADGTSGIYIWGAQVEQQSYATSYIPTSGTTVTRVGETCVNATPEINSEEGVLYAEIAALANDGTYRILSLSNGSSVERIYMQYTNASNTLSAVVKKGSVTQANISYILTNETDFNKIAFKYKENDFALWVNGVKIGTDTSGLTPIGLSEFSFDNGTGGNDFYGNTKDIQIFNEALSDYQLAQLTTI